MKRRLARWHKGKQEEPIQFYEAMPVAPVHSNYPQDTTEQTNSVNDNQFSGWAIVGLIILSLVILVLLISRSSLSPASESSPTDSPSTATGTSATGNVH